METTIKYRSRKPQPYRGYTVQAIADYENAGYRAEVRDGAGALVFSVPTVRGFQVQERALRIAAKWVDARVSK